MKERKKEESSKKDNSFEYFLKLLLIGIIILIVGIIFMIALSIGWNFLINKIYK